MIGQTISHYKITAKLGAGGMGEVYLATDTKLDRQVALKFLPESLRNDPEARQRLLREAKAASKLNHPNILTVHAVEEAEGRDFIAMEYVEGASLRDKVRDGDLDICRIIEMAIQIGEGLAEAHAAGVVHRDIKSDNVIISAKDKAKVMDFGLATWRGASQLTKEGSTVGTMAYMSPEQAQGQPVDQRTDLWSLGVVLYEMVTRRLPFEGDHDAAITYSIVNEMPHPLARYSADVPEELQRIVSKCLNKNRDERYQSASDLVADLRALRRFSSASGVPAAKPSRKHSRLIATLSVVGVAVIAVAAAFLTDLFRSGEEVVAPERKMLAVLPFQNLGAEDQEYFADGVTEEIMARLAGVSAIGVISRQSSMQYKGTTKTLHTVGEELGVDYILEGTIRWDRSGPTDRVRITPQLVRVEDDTHLWADVLDLDLTEIFAAQSEIAIQVSHALQATLTTAEERSLERIPTESLEAYNYYLQGLEYWSTNELDLCESMFEQAISLDSNFALAYARLSRLNSFYHFLGADPEEGRLQRASSLVSRAQALAPDLAEVHVAQGFYHYHGYRDYKEAQREFDIALRSQPSNSDIIAATAYVKRRLGLWPEHVELMERAILLKPLSVDLRIELLGSLIRMRRFSEARHVVEDALSLFPESPEILLGKAQVMLFGMGDLATTDSIFQYAVNELGISESVVMEDWLYLDWYRREPERSLDRNLRFLISESTVADTARYYYMLGEVYFLLDSIALSMEYFDSARICVEPLHEQARSWGARLPPSLGKIYARLGWDDKAIQAALRDLDKWPLARDALIGADAIVNLAETYAYLGDIENSIDAFERAMSVPCYLTAVDLKLDPRYDALRDHPRFQALIEKGDVVF